MEVSIDTLNLVENPIDTFVIGIERISAQLGVKLPLWRIYGETGMGARLTIAMNVRSGREIGHPSSNYSWDIVSVAEHCFESLGIQWQLYVNSKYANPAKRTAAQSSRFFSENVHVIDENKPPELKGHILHPHSDGNWIYTNQYVPNNNDLPFGDVALLITGITPTNIEFPVNTLKYLFNTLERGEEPMEFPGKGHYAPVSGWKAYARWMQSYVIPLKGIQHPFINNIALLTLERRIANAYYWNKLSNILSDELEIKIATELARRYFDVVRPLQKVVEQNTYEWVKEAYFTEQKTLPTYKLFNKSFR